MSRVRTLTDIRIEENSIQSVILREVPVEDASTQTSLSGLPITSNLNETLREIARQRLERGESNLPLRPNLYGSPIADSAEFRNLNEVLSEETRIDILRSIANDTYRGDLIQTILSNISTETLTSLRNSLQGPFNNLEAYTPFLNILMYSNVGLNDFNTATSALANLITDMQAPTESPILDVEDTVVDIDERNLTTNQNVIYGAEEFNSRRNNILSSLNGRTILYRGGMLFTAGITTYFGSPYIGTLAGIGIRMLQDLENSSGTGINTRQPGTNII
jgi:hypothetical protein